MLAGSLAALSGSFVTGATGFTPAAVAATGSGGFVSAQGTQLVLDGGVWDFAGYNAYQLPSLQIGGQYQCGGQYSLGWLDSMLDEMRSSSNTTVVRTWFFQSYSQDNFAQLDAVVQAAAARNIKIIPVIANQWGACEGPKLQDPYKGIAWYEGGYKQVDAGYTMSYRSYAIALARHFANNPTIAFWQLMNEAEARTGWGSGTSCNESAAANALRSFADDVTHAIKAVDPSHLVSLGTMGGGQCGTQGSDYQYVNAGAIDICEYHDYWNAIDGGDQWNGVTADTAMCHALDKPIFVGEAGIDASVMPDWSTPGPVTAASLQQRALFFDEKARSEIAAGAVGFLAWDKTFNPSTSYDIGPGDPTEAVMATLQQQLALSQGMLPDGQFITGGDPTSSGGVAPAGTPAALAPAPAGPTATSHTRPAAAATAGSPLQVVGQPVPAGQTDSLLAPSPTGRRPGVPAHLR